MLISYSHRFLFVHVWKVAGTSIREALGPFAHNPRKTLPNRILRAFRLPLVFPTLKSTVFEPHISTREVRDRLPAPLFQNLFKFAFVRNPWDLQVSLYHYMRQTPIHPHHAVAKSFGNFQEYLHWLVRQRVRLQQDFVVDEHGQVLVDFVGRFESIEADFREVCHRLGICTGLKSLNISRHRDYRTYYDRRTIKLVEDHYRDDIERFEYTFDQAAQSPASFPALRSAA